MTNGPRGLSAFLTVLALATLAAIGWEVIHLPQRPIFGMSEQGTVVQLVDPDGPAWRAGIRSGDRIVEIAGRPVRELVNPSGFLRARGTEATRLVVEREGRRLHADLVPDTPTDSELGWQIALAVTAGATLLIGAWVVHQRLSEVTVVFFGICFSISVLSFRPYVLEGAGGEAAATVVIGALSTALPGLLLHFFLLFPFERRTVREHRWLLALVYFPAVLLLPFLGGNPIISRYLPFPNESLQTLGQLGTAVYWILSLVLSLAFFTHSFRSSPLPIVKAKLRVTLIGTILGLVPLLVVLLAYTLRPEVPIPGDRLANLAVVFLPASFGYAILRHGIFDTEFLIKRGFVYSALTSAFLLVYFLLFLGLSTLLQGATGFEERVGTALALAFAVLFLTPARARLQEQLDRWVYPDRFSIRRPLRETALRLQEAHGMAGVEGAIVDALGTVMGLDRAVLFRKTDAGLESGAAIGLKLRPGEIVLSRHLADPLLGQSRPISRAELEDRLPYGYLPGSDLRELGRMAARVFVPLTSPRGRFGALVLGPRAFGERYTAPDFELLEGLQAQAVLALENALLEEERRGHATLAEELDVARSLQRELLPRALPRLTHLDVAAETRPCFAVGGDYYDCVNLADGSVGLAIADVSGHGVPAALLMANIQAIFRAEAHSRHAPAEVLAALNARLCAIDRPERFATFFAALWEPSTDRFLYANGGHARPILARAGGTIERLEEGGLVLGIQDDAPYATGEVRLEPGDLLLLYTDGVVEQGGPDGVFQEDQLVSFVAAHRHLSPRDLVGRILEQIDPAREEIFADDATLLVLKRL